MDTWPMNGGGAQGEKTLSWTQQLKSQPLWPSQPSLTSFLLPTGHRGAQTDLVAHHRSDPKHILAFFPQPLYHFGKVIWHCHQSLAYLLPNYPSALPIKMIDRNVCHFYLLKSCSPFKLQLFILEKAPPFSAQAQYLLPTALDMQIPFYLMLHSLILMACSCW